MNKKLVIVVSTVVILSSISLFLFTTNFGGIFITSIHGENYFLYYEGYELNGDAFFHNGDTMEMNWKIVNYDEGVITNWLVWVQLKDPNNDYHTAYYYGSSPIGMDETVYLTTDFSDIFDIVGAWDITVVTLEGDYLGETNVVIDRIDNEDLVVAYVLNLDITSYSIVPDEIMTGDEVTISYSVKNNGDVTSGVDLMFFPDLNGNGIRDTSTERMIYSDWDDALPVGHSLTGTVIRTLTSDDAVGDTAYIVLYASAWEEYGPFQPDFHTSETVTVIISTSPPDIGISYTMTILTVPSNCDVSLIGFDVVNSGDDGIAVFEGVPYGSYNVMVSKTGYPTFSKTVFINSDAVISTDLSSQKYLIPILFLSIVGIAAGLVVYWYKKKT